MYAYGIHAGKQLIAEADDRAFLEEVQDGMPGGGEEIQTHSLMLSSGHLMTKRKSFLNRWSMHQKAGFDTNPLSPKRVGAERFKFSRTRDTEQRQEEDPSLSAYWTCSPYQRKILGRLINISITLIKLHVTYKLLLSQLYLFLTF